MTSGQIDWGDIGRRVAGCAIIGLVFGTAIATFTDTAIRIALM